MVPTCPCLFSKHVQVIGNVLAIDSSATIMESEDQDKEGVGNSYPDPSNQSTGVHPFYADRQSARDAPIAQAPTAPMHGSNGDSKAYPPQYMQAQYPQPSTPQQLAQRGLNVNQNTSQDAQDSAKKKQKVSRACDECRRKKVSYSVQSDAM